MGDDRPAKRMNIKESGRIYLRRINRVIDHIAENLAEPLPLEQLAKLAHFSPFHFHLPGRSLRDSRRGRTVLYCVVQATCAEGYHVHDR
jgi:hypothetical protein